MKNKNQTNTNQQIRPSLSDKVIQYHPLLQADFGECAENCGWDESRLREATEAAITSRHHEATILGAPGNRPDIFLLSLGSANVLYTVEQDVVMVHGYCWELL